MKAKGFFAVTLVLGLIGVSSLFAQQEKAQAVAAPASPAPQEEKVWLDDELPANAKTEGTWGWDTTTVASGTKSHGHPSAKGLQSHGFTAAPATLSADGMIVQQVWLDPQDPPKGIMLKFKLASGEEVGVYWEGEEEVFSPGEEEEVWYYGLLPELGKWTSLEVLAEDLGLEGEQLTGVRFVTFDGRALWDKTAIAKAPPVTESEFVRQLPTAGAQSTPTAGEKEGKKKP